VLPEVSVGHGFWAACKSLERASNKNNELIEGARCFRREALLALGGYDPQLEAWEDWDLQNRAKRYGLCMGRTKSSVIHDEGHPTLTELLKKKYNYGKTLRQYLNTKPPRLSTQISPLQRVVIPSLAIIPADPIHGLGVLTLKSLELMAAGIGHISAANVRSRSRSTERTLRMSLHQA
jgi:arabinofuranan 3-O-arabinosyltransferase